MLTENLCILICFVLFWLLAFKPIKQQVFSVLKSKTDKIIFNIEDIQKLKEEVISQITYCQKKINILPELKNEALNQAQVVSNKIISLKEEELKNSLIKIQQDTDQKIVRMQQEALLNIQKEILRVGYISLVTYVNDSSESLPKDQVIFEKLVQTK